MMTAAPMLTVDERARAMLAAEHRKRLQFSAASVVDGTNTWIKTPDDDPALAALTIAISQLDEARAVEAKWRRAATDRDYMIAALTKMLGPKGQQVWTLWQEKGVQRIHFDWGPEGLSVIGEEAAQLHLDIEAATENAVPIDDIDEHITAPNIKPAAPSGEDSGRNPAKEN